MHGLVKDFTFAAYVNGRADPWSTQMYLPMPDGRTTLANFFSPQVHHIEPISDRQAPVPGRADLLTTGMTAAGVEVSSGTEALETPHLAVRYQPTRESTILEELNATADVSATPPWPRRRRPRLRRRRSSRSVTTVWTYQSHAQHMGDRFLVGYPRAGQWHKPPIKVVSLYVDQKPEGDLSADRAAEHGFTVYPTIAEALRCGGDKLAVDGVVIIGEHGNYPRNDKGQILYPRYEFFRQVVDGLREGRPGRPRLQRQAPVLQRREGRAMVADSKRLKFPFLAGSSLPVTWRLPSVEIPYDAEIEEALMVGVGGSDAMDYHALEAMQCMVERRKGGETGVKSVQMLEGDAVWKARRGRVSKELLTAGLRAATRRKGYRARRPHPGPGRHRRTAEAGQRAGRLLRRV